MAESPSGPLRGARSVWIGGASRGIGADLHRSLEEEGWDVLPLARSLGQDLAQPDTVEKLLAERPCPYAWLHCVGDYLEKEILETQRADWEHLFASNFISVLHAARALLPRMAAEGGGRFLVFGTSGLSLATGKVRAPAYFAVKSALLSAIKSLARQWAPLGITINMISPGVIVHEHSHAESAQRMADRIPVGRTGRTEDLRGIVELLLDDRGSYITGEEISVDGGLFLQGLG